MLERALGTEPLGKVEPYLSYVYRIWIVDTNREFSSAVFDGFDISEDMYPQKVWLPANVLLRTLNIKEPVPAELVGQYDIVNLWLFIDIVDNDDDAKNILSNLKTLLSTISSPRFFLSLHFLFVKPWPLNGVLLSLIS